MQSAEGCCINQLAGLKSSQQEVSLHLSPALFSTLFHVFYPHPQCNEDKRMSEYRVRVSESLKSDGVTDKLQLLNGESERKSQW